MEAFPEGLVATRESGVLTLTIDRPDDFNRLSPEVISRLPRAHRIAEHRWLEEAAALLDKHETVQPLAAA
jgi:hypothetical protein